jgi:hypothetical protein
MVRKAVIVRETLKVAERTERLRKASAVAYHPKYKRTIDVRRTSPTLMVLITENHI